MNKPKKKASLKAKLLLAAAPLILFLMVELLVRWLAPEPSWDDSVPVLADMVAQVNLIEGDIHKALEENPLLKSNYSLYDSHRTLFWILKENFSEDIINFMSPLVLNPEIRKLKKPEWIKERVQFRAATGPHRYANPQFKEKKEKGVFRLICMGDSNTFGWGVNPDQSYPYFLTRKLKAALPHKKLEVINMGTPGYSSLQGRTLAKEKVSKMEADLVVVGYGFNDRWPITRSDKDQLEAQQGLGALVYYIGKSRVLLWAKRLAMDWFVQSESKTLDLASLSEEEKKKRMESTVKRVSPGDHGQNMGAIYDILKASGAQVVFLDIFCMGQWEDQLKKAAKQRKAAVIDGEGYLTDLLEKLKIKDTDSQVHGAWALKRYGEDVLKMDPRLALFNDNCHPNAYGYELLADQVAQHLLKHFFTGK